MRFVSRSFFICAIAFAAVAAHAQVGPRVAIVAAAANTANAQTNNRFTDPRDMLVADGRFSQVDIISTTPFGGGGTPSLATLMQYDAILHWTNDSNADSVGLGNVFADYIDAGGAVVVAVFANTSTHQQRYLQGRWLTGGYEIIPSQGGHLEGASRGHSRNERARSHGNAANAWPPGVQQRQQCSLELVDNAAGPPVGRLSAGEH